MAEQIKFGDRLFLKGDKIVLDVGTTGEGIIKSTSGTVKIEGNLWVEGTTTTVDTETVTFKDDHILIGFDSQGVTPQPTFEGIEAWRDGQTNAQWSWDEINDRWTAYDHDIHTDGDGYFDNIFVTGGYQGDVISDNGVVFFDATGDGSIDARAGNIDNTVIGATTPAQATFTQANANAFSLNGSLPLTSVDTDLTTVSPLHDSIASALAIKTYVDGSSAVTIQTGAPVPLYPGDLYFDDVEGRMYIYYDDGDSQQWIDTNPPFALPTIDEDLTTVSPGHDTLATALAIKTYVDDQNQIIIQTNAPLPANHGDLYFDDVEGRMYIYYDDGSSAQWIDTNPPGDVTSVTIDAAGAVMNTDSSTAAMSFVIDEDSMLTNSNTLIPTQQSVKAYVDANGGNQYLETAGVAVPTTGYNGGDIWYDTTNEIYYALVELGGSPIWLDIGGAGGSNTLDGLVSTQFMRSDIPDSHSGTITPTLDNTIDLGSPLQQYANVYATTFQGTATSARYADLAEKYTTDADYAVGTVMMVSFDKKAETTKCNALRGMPIGVISDKPAYVMNSECEGQAIGLKGRVPVRIVGPVKKGQPVFATEHGTASAGFNSQYVVGVALETSNDSNEKLIECVLKV